MWKSCQEEDVPPPSCELTVLASLSRLPLPDLVVTEFVEMRLVEVNGAGWCLQLVSNRRGPGHLILCLLVARRRTNRSCRDGARAENKTQRSHAKQEAANTGCGLAGGDQLGRMLRAPLGPPMYLGSPWRPAAAAAHGSAPPPAPAPVPWAPRREPLPPPTPPRPLLPGCSVRPGCQGHRCWLQGREGPRGQWGLGLAPPSPDELPLQAQGLRSGTGLL